MPTTSFTTKKDLRTHMVGLFGPDLTGDDFDRVVDRILQEGCATGLDLDGRCDWAGFIDSIDINAPYEWLDGARDSIARTDEERL